MLAGLIQAQAVGDRGGLHLAGDAELGEDVETCTLAVLGLMNSAWAIWRLLRPAATSTSTSTSRG